MKCLYCSKEIQGSGWRARNGWCSALCQLEYQDIDFDARSQEDEANER